LRLTGSIGFGKIFELRVRNGQPEFEPMPRILCDVKFGNRTGGPSRKGDAKDYILSDSQIELLSLLDDVGNGIITVLEIRHSSPFRATISPSPQDLR